MLCRALIFLRSLSTSRCFRHHGFIEDSTLSECALLLMLVIVSMSLLVYSYVFGFHIENCFMCYSDKCDKNTMLFYDGNTNDMFILYFVYSVKYNPHYKFTK